MRAHLISARLDGNSRSGLSKVGQVFPNWRVFTELMSPYAWRMRQAPVGQLLAAILAISATALAQSGPDGTPGPQPGPGATPSSEAPAWAPAPQPQPLPPSQPEPQNAAAPSPVQPAPYAAQPTNAYAQPYGSNSTVTANGAARADNSPNSQRYGYANEDPNRPGYEEPKSNFEMPQWSVRIDPFNWLLAGRLGLELEMQVYKFVSVELVPVFVVNDQPPYLNLGFVGVPNTLKQKSAGVGALAGSSIGVGFWLNGKPMEGYVLRAELTNYSIDYDTSIDHVNYVEREFQILLGQHSKWGPFTIAGTFGLGTMLNSHERCFANDTPGSAQTSGCPNGKQMLLALTPANNLTGQPMGVINLNSWAYPIDLILRISLGVAF